MAEGAGEGGEEEDEWPCVDHSPLNEGAVGKRIGGNKKRRPNYRF